MSFKRKMKMFSVIGNRWHTEREQQPAQFPCAGKPATNGKNTSDT
jgi:hypothetical protein